MPNLTLLLQPSSSTSTSSKNLHQAMRKASMFGKSPKNQQQQLLQQQQSTDNGITLADTSTINLIDQDEGEPQQQQPIQIVENNKQVSFQSEQQQQQQQQRPAKAKAKSPKTNERERKVLLQMSVLVAVFLCCWMPFWLCYISLSICIRWQVSVLLSCTECGKNIESKSNGKNCTVGG